MDTLRGLEVLLKKASVDAHFRTLLLENRSDAAMSISLELDPAEAAMLDTMPADQLDAIVQRTRVPPEDRRVFLGKVASVMLAALGAGVSGCKKNETNKKEDNPTPAPPQPVPATRGHAADNPGRSRPVRGQSPGTSTQDNPGTASTC
jgi:hypothetical protein